MQYIRSLAFGPAHCAEPAKNNIKSVSDVVGKIDEQLKEMFGRQDLETVPDKRIPYTIPFFADYTCNHKNFYLEKDNAMAHRLLTKWPNTPGEYSEEDRENFREFRKVCNIGTITHPPF